ncbi:hypothetical protein LguiB_002273 [Lonicera macranthoides]
MASDPNNADGTYRKYEQKKDEEEDLIQSAQSEEDMELKHQLELYVHIILQDSETGLKRNALESLRHEIRISTSSMTAVPKPLKFLYLHYATLKAFYETMADLDLKKLLADILSILVSTMPAEGDRALAHEKISQGPRQHRHLRGKFDLRNLAGEVSQEYVERRSGEDNEIDDLMELHNAEHEAVDLLLEVEDLSTLVDHVNSTTYERACLYLISIARFLPKSDAFTAMDVAHSIYMDFHEFTRALQTSLFLDIEEVCTKYPELNMLQLLILRVNIVPFMAKSITINDAYTFVDTPIRDPRKNPNDLRELLVLGSGTHPSTRNNPRRPSPEASVITFISARVSDLILAPGVPPSRDVEDIFRLCDDLSQKNQFCCILARHGIAFQLDDFSCKNDDDRVLLQNIINNHRLSEGYLILAHDIEVMEPKLPTDIFKAHLLDNRGSAAASIETAGLNLAATFVNAFVNAGFQRDSLTTDATGEWLFKNKEHRRISATASLGMIYLWDVAAGLAPIKKYLFNNDNHIVAGALLAAGIVNCGINIDSDPALELFNHFLDEENLDQCVKLGAIMGMGLSYAGTKNQEIKSRLTPIIEDVNSPPDVTVFAAISLGLVFVGTCNSLVTQTLLSVLQSRIDSAFGDPLTRLLPLSLGLNLLGKQERAEAAYVAFTSQFNTNIRKYCDTTLLSCAYAGTGNLLEVQHFLGQCNEQLEEAGAHLGPAVIGIAMVAMAEEVGLQMATRSLEHRSQSGEPNIRRAVPLALALLYISDPKAALISLGLIGAGTNNGRIAGILRNLSSFYNGEEDLLFCVQIAQGLLHMGKGLLTLAPYHSDRFLLCRTALAGIIILLHACLNMRATILGKYHYVIYYLVLAMQPRMLMTVDESLKPLSVPVRVGQAVNDGQAGRPRTITSFKTHSTPILLGAGEKAELATNKYIPLSPFLEGFVILKKNPNYRDDS